MAVPRNGCGKTDLDIRYIEVMSKTLFSNGISWGSD